jgi:osmotically-inducible protein OsmY
MRYTKILTALAACTLLAATGCASVQKVEAEVKSNPNALKGAEDDALLVTVKAALEKNPKTRGVSASVKGGVVTLTGSGGADVKAEAEKTAKVPGVSSVTNNIK